MFKETEQSCEGKGPHRALQSLPVGFHLNTPDTPFWTLTPEECKRHQNYETKSNNWLKRHGQPMRRRCMGKKTRRSYMFIDEGCLLLGQAAEEAVRRVWQMRRQYQPSHFVTELSDSGQSLCVKVGD